MNSNVIGFLISQLLMLSTIGIAEMMVKSNYISADIMRKLLHIAASNWWLLAMYYFTGLLWPSLCCLAFIAIGLISFKENIFKAMKSPEGEANPGTLYFPLSLLILTLFCFGGTIPPYAGAIGVLTMGYGDGLAAIVGKGLGKRKFFIGNNEKSLVGSFTMFVISWLVTFIILYFFNPVVALQASLLCAATATTAEAVTPARLDNLTVPLLTTFIYSVFFIPVAA